METTLKGYQEKLLELIANGCNLRQVEFSEHSWSVKKKALHVDSATKDVQGDFISI